MLGLSHLLNRFGFIPTVASLIFCTTYASSNCQGCRNPKCRGIQIDWSIFQKYKSSIIDAEKMESLRQEYFIPGNPFKNGYTKDKEIGKGGCGQVFKCKNTKDNKVYAIKKLAKPQTGYKCMHYNYEDGVAEEHEFVKEMRDNKTHYMLVPSLEYDRNPKKVLKTNVTFETPLKVMEIFGDWETVPLELGASTLHDVLAETLIQKSISHENVIGIEECYEDDENYYIVMEYVEGEELFDVLMRQDNPFYKKEKETMKIINQIVDALKAIHEAGFGHYDLTMQNIIICKENGELKAKIIDFGLAGHVKSFLTPRGTRDETAPEQRIFMKENGTFKVVYDQRADFWSIGYICYVMLCGNRPFHLDGKARPDLKFYNKETIDFYNGFLKCPQYNRLSQQCQRFISLCLRHDPKQRLSSDRKLLPLELTKRDAKSMQKVMEAKCPSHNLKITGKHLSTIFTSIQDAVRKIMVSHSGNVKYDVDIPDTITEEAPPKVAEAPESLSGSSDSERSEVPQPDSISSSSERFADVKEHVKSPQDPSSSCSSERAWEERRRLAECAMQAQVLRDFAKSKKKTV